MTIVPEPQRDLDAGVSFPVWLKSDILDRDAQVFTLRLAEGAKAYPVDRVLEAGIVNDRIGTEPILVLGDRTSGSVRAYRRGTYQFERTREGWLEDNLGGRWSVEERGFATWTTPKRRRSWRGSQVTWRCGSGGTDSTPRPKCGWIRSAKGWCRLESGLP